MIFAAFAVRSFLVIALESPCDNLFQTHSFKIQAEVVINNKTKITSNNCLYSRKT